MPKNTNNKTAMNQMDLIKNNSINRYVASQYLLEQNNPTLNNIYSEKLNKEIKRLTNFKYNGTQYNKKEINQIAYKNTIDYMVNTILPNNNKLKDFRNYQKEYKSYFPNSISQIDQFKNNIINSNFNKKIRLSGSEFYKPKNNISNIDNENDIYKKLVNFFDVVSKKKTDNGSGIILKSINGAVSFQNRITNHSMSIQGIKQSRNAILNADSVVVFDTETMGGKNKYGQQEIGQITEFAFHNYNVQKNNKTVADNTINYNNSVSNVLGISPTDEEKYKDIINRFKNNPNGQFTEQDKVILDRLFKMGYKDAKIEHLGNGQFKANIAEESFSDYFDIDAVEKGLNNLRDVWDIAHKKENLNPETGLTLAQSQLINVMKNIQKDNTVLVGHNIIQADIPWINRELPNIIPQKILEKNNISNIDLNQNNVIDTYQILNGIVNTDNPYKYFGDKIKNIGSKENINKTFLSQEVLLKAMGINQGSSAHNAFGDALGNAEFVLGIKDKGSSILNKSPMLNIVNRYLNDSSNKSAFLKDISYNELASNNYLFRASDSIYNNIFNADNKLNFLISSGIDNGYITTSGKLIMKNKFGTYANDYGQSTVRKGGMFSISDIGSIDIDPNSETSKAIKQLVPELSQNKLFYTTLQPVYDKAIKGASDNQRLNSPYTIFATSKNQLVDKIQSLDLVGQKQNGSWSNINITNDNGQTDKDLTNKVNKQIRNNYSLYSIGSDDNGNAIVKEQKQQATTHDKFLNDLISKSTQDIIDESSERYIRDERINKVKSIDSTLDYINNTISKGVDDIFNNKNSLPSEYDDFINELKSYLSQMGVTNNADKETIIRDIMGKLKSEGYNSNLINALGSAMTNELKNLYSSIPLDVLAKNGFDTAVQVAQNKIGQGLKIPSFIPALSYQFNNKTFLPQTTQLSSTLDVIGYANKIKPLNELIINKLSNPNTEINNEIYKTTLDRIKSYLSENKTVQEKRGILNNNSTVTSYKKDMMYFDAILNPKIFQPDINSKFDLISKENLNENPMRIRINLANNSFNLGKKLSNRLDNKDRSVWAEDDIQKSLLTALGTQFSNYNESSNDKTNLAVRNAFKDFKNNNNKIVPGIINDNMDKENLIDINKDLNAKTLSNIITTRLKSLVNNDVSIGKEVPRYETNIDDSEFADIIDQLSSSNSKQDNIVWNNVKDIVSNTISDLNKTVIKNDHNTNITESVVSDYVKSMHKDLSNTYGDWHNLLRFGYSENQAKFESNKYKLALSELIEYNTKLFKSVQNSKMNIDIDNTGVYFSSKGISGKSAAINNLPILVTDDLSGGLGVKFGNNVVSLKMYMQSTKDGFKSRTSIGHSLDNLGYNIDKSLRNQVYKKGNNPTAILQSAVSVVSNMNLKLMENPSIANHNVMNASQSLVYDYKEITSALIKDKNIINNIKFSSDPKEATIQKEAFNNTIKNINNIYERTGKVPNFNELIGGDKEVVGALLYQIRDNVLQNSNLDPITREALSNLNIIYKDTHMVSGEGIIGSFGIDSYEMLDNEQRPNKFQQITTAFDENKAISSLIERIDTNDINNTKEDIAKNILGFNHSIRSKMSDYRDRGMILNRAYRTSITPLSLQTSQLQYETLITKHFADKIKLNNNLSYNERKIKDILYNTSLNDQEGVLDSRVVDSIVNHNTRQYVPFNKDWLVEHDSLVKDNNRRIINKTINDMSTIKNKIMPYFEIDDDGNLNVKLRREGKYVKRFDPLVYTQGFGNIPQEWRTKARFAKARLRFFTQNNIELTEEQLNKSLSENKDFNNISRINGDIVSNAFNYLSSKFNTKLAVDDLTYSSYRKVMLGRAEKGEATNLHAGLGTLNDYYVSAINKTTNDNKNIALKSIIKNPYIRDKKILGDITLRDLTGLPITEDTMKSISKKISSMVNNDSTFKYSINPTDLYKTMMQESYAPSKYLFDNILKEQQEKIEAITGKRIVNISSAREVKHLSANEILESNINLILDTHMNKFKGKDKAKAYEELLKNNHFRNILIMNGKSGFRYDNKSNNIYISRDYKGGDINNYLDVDELNTVMKQYGLSYKNNGEERYGLQVKGKGYNSDYNLGQVRDNTLLFIDEESKTTGSGAASARLRSNKVDPIALRKYNGSSKLIERGVSISDRESLMMNFARTDTVLDYLNKTYKDLISNTSDKQEKTYLQNEWNQLSSPYMKDNKIDNQYVDKPLMEYFTKSAKELQLISPEDKLTKSRLSDIDINSSRYNYLKNIYKKYNNGKDISIESAEKLYGINENLKAIRYNSKELSLEDIMKKDKQTYLTNKITPLELVRVGENGTINNIDKADNNIYTNNLIIDPYGEKLSPFIKNDSDRYIATGRLPLRTYGNTSINYEYQNAIRRLQNSKENINNSIMQYGINSNEVQRQIGLYKEKVNYVKESLNQNILGKQGVFDNLRKVRMPISSTTKAAGFIYLNNNELLNYMNTNKSNKDVVNTLLTARKALNEGGQSHVLEALSNINYNGKTLLEHQNNKNYLDVTYLSEEAFDIMGLFDKVHQKAILGNGYKESNDLYNKEKLRQYYSHNAILGVVGRYPTNYETSFKPELIALNTNLAGQKSQGSAEGILTAFGDYDGDLKAMYVATFGKKQVTSAVLDNILKEHDNTIRQQKLNKYNLTNRDLQAYNDSKMLMTYHSRGINQIYHKKLVSDIFEDMNNSNADIRDVVSNRKMSDTNKYLFNFKNGDKEQYNQRYKEMQDIVSRAYDNKNISKEKLYSRMDEIIKNTEDNQLRTERKNAVAYNIISDMTTKAQFAGYKKSSIGVANLPLFADRQLSELVFKGENRQQRDFNRYIIQDVSGAIEQSVISSKKDSSALELYGKTQRFTQAHNDLLFKGQSNRMNEFFNEISYSDLKKHVVDQLPYQITNGLNFKNKSEDEAKEMIRKAYIDAQMTIHNSLGPTGIRNFLGAYKLGNSITSVKRVGTSVDFLLDTGTMASSAVKHLINISDEYDQSNAKRILSNKESIRKRKEIGDILKGTKQQAYRENNKKNVLLGISNSIEKAAKKVTGKELALGALGLAGSFLIASFAGGGEITPSSDQAQAMADNGFAPGDFYTIPNLSDNNNPNRQQQGYVINVNAKTEKDRQHAVNAVSNAVSQSYPTNVNISMNINPDSGDLTDRNIENMISNALN